MDESNSDHSEAVLCRFLKASEYASAFLEPSDESFDDVP